MTATQIPVIEIPTPVSAPVIKTQVPTPIIDKQTPVISTQSLRLARDFIGKEVEVTVDRKIGSKHPKYGFIYPVNYGYIAGVEAPDGEELDAYYLGATEPLDFVVGSCIAVIHRKDDDDDKLVVVPIGTQLADKEILAATRFQEQWFDCKIIRKYIKNPRAVTNEKK